jgi:hypothetical protein
VSEPIHCRDFQRKLDERSAGNLSAEDERLLRAHGENCPDCTMLLRMQEHLAALSSEELESLVPDELVVGMYGRVIDAIEERSSDRFRLSSLFRPRAILVPALSAAVVLLLVGAAWMFGELRSIRQKEQALSLRVEKQESQLQQVEKYASFAASAASSKWTESPRETGWRRSLPVDRDLRVSELRTLLDRLPSGLPILDAGESELLLGRIGHRLGPSAERTLAGIRTDDGLAAAEVLQILEVLELDEEMTIPTARVLSLTRRIPSSTPIGIERGL